VVGRPIDVPGGLSDEAQAQTCRALEATLEDLRRRACVLAGVEA